MATVYKNAILQYPPNAVIEIQKIHNLDKPGRVDDAIDILQEWLKKQDHILKKDFDRDYLGTGLILCKGSVEKAKKQIDRLCTLKTLLPRFFDISNPKLELKQFLEQTWITPLPKITKDYYRVFFVKTNVKVFTSQFYIDCFRYNINICEYLKAHDYVNGFIIVFDFQETSVFDMVTKIDTVELQQYISIIIEGFGARLKGIHMITESKVIGLFVKLLRQFLSQKLGSRIHVHKTAEEMYEVVPRHILPKEYGGDERSLTELHELWIEALSSEEHVKYMKMMNKACTDEKLRRPDKFNEEYMGTPGAFRNLSVD